MQIRTTAVLVASLAAAVAAQSVGSLTISVPTTLKEIETDKAQPYRLAWSPDGTEIYVQTLEGTFNDAATNPSKVKFRHYLFTADGAKKDVSAEPEWAKQYWAAKSGKASPDAAAFAIDVKESQEIKKSGSAPVGGEMARGGAEGGSGGSGSGAGGSSVGDAALAAAMTQRIRVLTMTLKGEPIGKFENSVMVPGLTYGWGSKGTKAVVFASPNNGKLIVMDDQGTKKEIAGTKDAVVPAWSPDGRKIAWLQKDGKKKYLLQVAAVSGS